MTRELTKAQIITKLNNDINFYLNFVVDNSPSIVASVLRENGFQGVGDPDTAFERLIYLYKTDKAKLREILLKIPYDNTADNYTGGFIEYFKSENLKIKAQSGISMQKGGTVLTAILAGVGATATMLATSLGTGDTASTQMTAEQIAAAKKKAEEEEKKRKTRNAIIMVAGITVFVIIAVVIVKSGKKPKPTKKS